MSNSNKASAKAEARTKLKLEDGDTNPVQAREMKTGEVKFRVSHKKGFKPGQTIIADKARAEGWVKKNQGKIVT